MLPSKALLLGCGVLAMVLAMVLQAWPRARPSLVPTELFWRALVPAAAGAMVAGALHPGGWLHPDTAKLAAGVFVLGFALGGAAFLLAAAGGKAQRDGAYPACLGFAALTTAPLWLGPWAGYVDANGFVNAVIALSPLTYLAVLVDYDYLHSQWFYAHTPFGGLRFEYPGPLIASAIYGLVGAACWGGGRYLIMRAEAVAPRHEEEIPN